MKRTKLRREFEDLETSNVLHFILTILTGGLWVIVWIWQAIVNLNKRVELLLKHIEEDAELSEVS